MTPSPTVGAPAVRTYRIEPHPGYLPRGYGVLTVSLRGPSVRDGELCTVWEARLSWTETSRRIHEPFLFRFLLELPADTDQDTAAAVALRSMTDPPPRRAGTDRSTAAQRSWAALHAHHCRPLHADTGTLASLRTGEGGA